MKTTIACIITILALSGCSKAVSSPDEWQGWTNEAAYLAKHYDEQLGVVCYLSTRQSSSRTSPLSCVKL